MRQKVTYLGAEVSKAFWGKNKGIGGDVDDDDILLICSPAGVKEKTKKRENVWEQSSKAAVDDSYH